MNSNAKYPDIEVQLTGEDGNAFAIMGAVTKALKRNGVDADEIAMFRQDCMSGNYDHLLRTCLKWVDVS